MVQAFEHFQGIPGVAAVLLVALAVAGALFALNRARAALLRRRPRRETEIRCLFAVARYAVLAVGALVALETLQVPIGSLWAAVSAMAALVAIGFVAMWSILSHVTAWLILLFDRPFRRGETVRLAEDDVGGKVSSFGPFFTTVEDEQGVVSRVPNNLFFQKRFTVTGTPEVNENEHPEPDAAAPKTGGGIGG